MKSIGSFSRLLRHTIPIIVLLISASPAFALEVLRCSGPAVTFDDENLWVLLRDGRQLSVPLAYFPRLLKASSEKRSRYEISGGGTGIHWDDLDEDISVAGLLVGQGDLTSLRKSI